MLHKELSTAAVLRRAIPHVFTYCHTVMPPFMGPASSQKRGEGRNSEEYTSTSQLSLLGMC